MAQRSAPASWGAWPPAPDRIRRVVDRAARQLASVYRDRRQDAPVVLLVQTYVPSELDHQFSLGVTRVTAGDIMVIGRRERWRIFWDPATDHGTIQRQFDHRA